MSSRHSPESVALRVAAHAGLVIGDARRQRRWTLRDLAERAGIAVSSLHAIEHGRPAGVETYACIASALALELRLDLVDPRKRASSSRQEDPVHAAMGEVIAAKLARHRYSVAIDEPYQHFQFAGRADVLAWDFERRALLHVENRTRFPNLQDAIGSYNAKRRYLPPIMAQRLGLRSGFASVTNVIVGRWSRELLHVIRIRSNSVHAVCPDAPSSFEGWLTGSPPVSGQTSAFVLFDPGTATTSRSREYVGLEVAIAPATRPRYRGYADALETLVRQGRA